VCLCSKCSNLFSTIACYAAICFFLPSFVTLRSQCCDNMMCNVFVSSKFIEKLPFKITRTKPLIFVVVVSDA